MSDSTLPDSDTSASAPALATAAGDAATEASEQDDEAAWAVLLDYVQEGTVIPVIGRDLLAVEVNDPGGGVRTALFYSLIAEELAATLKVRVTRDVFDGPNPLGAVASQFIVDGGAPGVIYRTLPGVVKKVDQRRVPGVPGPLRQLAEITDFNVFVTTTFDALLTDCVGTVRRTPPNVLDYAPRKTGPLVEFKVGEDKDRTLEILQKLPAPVVVHILGRLSSTPTYVVTEEDAFEFIYSLQETRPEGFFDLLAQMKLLIVGCRFPSWLVRYFLRTARRKRLLQSALDRTDFVVDAGAAEDAALVQFLKNFKTQTEIFTNYAATQFVAELHRRWTERTQPGRSAATDYITPCAIFISYASEDAAAAAAIAGQIGATLPVWLDQGRLGAGDEWARKIRRNIDLASAFVPIVSRSCLSSRSREFRKEWRHAYEVRNGLPRTEPFIYPIVIDDVPRNSAEIDEELRAIDWDTLADGGTLGDELMERLRKAFRNAQIRGRHG